MMNLIKFMASKLAERDCMISPDIKIDIDTDGFNFIRDQRVKGLIVFGDHYPLQGLDCSIKDHEMVMKAIQSVKPFGVIYKDLGEGGKLMYVPGINKTDK